MIKKANRPKNSILDKLFVDRVYTCSFCDAPLGYYKEKKHIFNGDHKQFKIKGGKVFCSWGHRKKYYLIVNALVNIENRLSKLELGAKKS